MKSLCCWPWKNCSNSAEGEANIFKKLTKNEKPTAYNNYSLDTEQLLLKDPPTDEIITTATFDGNNFLFECLAEHNRLRTLHGCPPLKLNKNLCNIAKNWAVHLANIHKLKHSNGKYGENLYMSSGYSINGKTPVQSWYNEIKYYNYAHPGFSFKTGHFTQVVWKSSRELGVGVEIRGNTAWVVANYNPPGNYANRYEQNVPRPLYKYIDEDAEFCMCQI